MPRSEGAAGVEFTALSGWAQDDHAAALAAFLRSADEGPNRDMIASAVLSDSGDARALIERMFRPDTPVSGHFTGYYEPQLDARLSMSPDFPVPIHAQPPGGCGLPRAQIGPAFDDHAIAWLRDEVDRFFLQVQGSGRLDLGEGKGLRLGFAARNGHPYRSIGRILVERGVFSADEITAEKLADWLRTDPERGRALMHENPSYVFFRVVDTAPSEGPIGAAGCSVSPGRSVAVDPAHHPLGSLLWIETDGIARLCVAQDVGSAIKGSGRVDLFFGTGAEAGAAAGRLNHAGRVVPLVPR